MARSPFTTSPMAVPSRPVSPFFFRASAHATCSDPGPWQVSHDTLISDHVVLYESVARS